jgi:precorrin-3B synthase
MTQTRRRGACPRLSAPMPTGDGLLARLMPAAPLPPAAMAALCAAAQAHGNGIIEITARGSLQVRGLTQDSALVFAAGVAALGIATTEGVPVIAPFDGGAVERLATQLRRALAAARLALSPKVSVVVDGGGAPHLDSLSADVRLRATGGDPCSPFPPLRFHLGLGCHPPASIGDGGHAAATGGAATTWLGTVAPQDAAAAVIAILTMTAAQGPAARVADVVVREGAAALRAVAAVDPAPPPPPRTAAGFVGLHPMGKQTALGIALAFGHADAGALTGLVGIAARHGARAVWPAPGHTLLIAGISALAACDLVLAAEQRGFVVRADDPRRRIAACPGAPACGSGLIAARTLAAALVPVVSPVAGPDRNGVLVHVSGCAKGCAHPAPAALTLVGTPQGCAVIHDGCAGDAPHRYIDPARLGEETLAVAPESPAPGSAEAADG